MHRLQELTMLSRSLRKEERDGITEQDKEAEGREVGRESGEGCEEWLERPLEARLSLWSQLDPSLRQGSALQER